MEPSGRNQWQSLANRRAAKTTPWADHQVSLAHGERLARLRLLVALLKRARELKREERVATGHLMHPLEQRP